MPHLILETNLGRDEGRIICGVDEVGRGPLAGPVLAAAVIIPQQGFPDHLAQKINDSKKLSERQREALYPLLTQHCVYAVAEATVREIDTINILNAALLAMSRAVRLLDPVPHHVLVDGNKIPRDLPCPATCVIKGDGTSLSIAAASIIAKVTRDRIMKALAQVHLDYGWERNAGYGTAAHMKALQELGPTLWHRRSFGPVAQTKE